MEQPETWCNLIRHAGYAGPFVIFISIGLFSALIQLFSRLRFFGFPITIAALFMGVISGLFQWALLVADVAKYGVPWWYGIMDPFWIIVDPRSYSHPGLVLPSTGVYLVTVGSVVVLLVRIRACVPRRESDEQGTMSDRCCWWGELGPGGLMNRIESVSVARVVAFYERLLQ